MPARAVPVLDVLDPNFVGGLVLGHVILLGG